MEIYLERDNKTINKSFNGIIKKLLLDLNILEDEVVIIKNDEIVTSNDEVFNNDDLKILSVVSGG